MRREDGLEFGAAADELDADVGQLTQRQHRAFDFYARGVVAAHRVQRDADHAQASSTSTRCSPL